MRSFGWKYALIFVILFIITFEFDYQVIPCVYVFVHPFFENLVYWTGVFVFNLSDAFPTVISSDSVGLYIHTFNLVFISGLLSFIWGRLATIDANKVRLWTEKVIQYYLSFQMLLYGFNKVFKVQFYEPEPNLLFTNLGDMTPDILYWSTIGSSWSYSFFIGTIEVIVAVFLLFNKTRLLAVLMGIGVMFNVVLINFSFDISVKLYASFLLFLFIILAVPFAKYLYASLILQNPILLKRSIKLFPNLDSRYRLGAKFFIIIIFLMEGLFPFYNSENYNDDIAKRPIFHGAYQVGDFSKGSNDMDWKYVFVHRGGYFISKGANEQMQDYQLEVDSINQTLLITRYDLNESFVLEYELRNKMLHHIFGSIKNSKVDIYLNKIDNSSIPLLNSSFHWTTNSKCLLK